jgi:hypothetical protein
LDVWLASQAGVALVTGIVYAYVARLILARHPSDAARVANYAFATWWVALGAVEFLVTAYQLPASLGYRDLAAVTTVLYVLLILLAAAIWGLVYYLVYLYTGSSRAFWPITVFYAALAVVLVFLVSWLDPIGFKPDGTLVTQNHFDAEHGYGTWALVLGLALSLPVVAAAIAYGSLYFRATARTQRFRIGVVAGSFLLWFGWSSVSSILGLTAQATKLASDGDPSLQHTLSLVNAAIGLVVPLFIVLAYQPPLWLRARLGVEAVA